MTEKNDDAARDLVQRAYAADPEPLDFDVMDGLRDVLHRSAQIEEPTTSIEQGSAAPAGSESQTMTRTAQPAFGNVLARAASEPLPPGPLSPGTIVASTIDGRIVGFEAREGRTIVFGRDVEKVHIGFGVNDLRVSRIQGELTYRDNRWWLSNTGRLPIRMPSGLLLIQAEIPLHEGYTPLIVDGTRGQKHLLELSVVESVNRSERIHPDDSRHHPTPWPLTETERLALTVLSQQYLHHETYPRPLSWQQAAAQLAELVPNNRWTSKRVEHIVAAVRNRLSNGGVVGLTRAEIGEPVGDTLKHNLIVALLQSGTLIHRDLQLLGEATREPEAVATGPNQAPKPRSTTLPATRKHA